MKIDKQGLLEKINSAFPEERVQSLRRLAEEWSQVGFGQAMKCREGSISPESLLDKLSSEVVEAQGALMYYAASSKAGKYTDQCVKEICDVGNMAFILMPILDDSPEQDRFPDYYEMLKSIAYHETRYGFEWVVPFDLSESYSRKELFGRYMKVVYSLTLQHRLRFGEDEVGRRRDTIERFHTNYIMLHKDMDEYLEQVGFSHMRSAIKMTSKWIRMTGDIITHSLLLWGEMPQVAYEDFFVQGTRKMRIRDARYHGIPRNS